MRNQLQQSLFFQDKLAVFFFFGGVLSGMLWVLWGSAGETASPGRLISSDGVSFLLKQGADWERTKQLFFERELTAVFLWMLGISLLAEPGISLFVFWSGFSMSSILVHFTMAWGWKAVFLFLLSLLPHFFFYVPVFMVLSAWAFGKNKVLHLPGLCFLLFLTGIGAAAEGMVSPFLCRTFFSCFL